MANQPQTISTVGGGSGGGMQGSQVEQGFNINFLITLVNSATISAKNKLQILQARRSAISIADMFDMQMLMNHLAQLSEMSTSIVSAANTSINSMARNVKG
jgi:hypothetical protein